MSLLNAHDPDAPVDFTMDVSPEKIATLTVKQSGSALFYIAMPIDQMRQLLHGLHSHLENHQENA